MKRAASLLALGILSLALLMGCAAPYTELPLQTPMPMVTPEPTPEPVLPSDSSVEIAAYDRGALPLSLKTESFPGELYEKMLAAASAGEEELDLSAENADEAAVKAARDYLLGRGLVVSLSDILYEKGILSFSYDSADAAALQAGNAAFDEEAARILSFSVRAGMSKLECALSLYQSLSQLIELQPPAESSNTPLYAAIVEKKADFSGLAKAYGFLLDQFGIENLLVQADDGSYVWNIITIDQISYHVDLSFAASLEKGQTLRYFGMSDEQARAILGYGEWSGSDGLSDIKPPICDSARFEALAKSTKGDADFAAHALYFLGYEGLEDVPVRLSLADGEIASPEMGKTAQFACLDGRLYFIAKEDGLLHVYDPEEEWSGPLEGELSATVLLRRGDELLYAQEEGGELQKLLIP
ncbi:MAG: hypothetical protein LBD02_01920 [Christensenellaceae bacterium]|nr:hypothetical protein [Christensenellaceae bacterium]